MADYARELNGAQRIRRMEEQIRRLQTRSLPRDFVEGWTSLAPQLAAEWTTSGVVGTDWYAARYYRDRDRVYFDGTVQASAAASTLVTSMPAGYSPQMLINATLHTDPDGTSAATNHEFWTVECLPGGGLFAAGQIVFDPNKNFAGGGFPPAGTQFYLGDLSYRISGSTSPT